MEYLPPHWPSAASWWDRIWQGRSGSAICGSDRPPIGPGSSWPACHRHRFCLAAEKVNHWLLNSTSFMREPVFLLLLLSRSPTHLIESSHWQSGWGTHTRKVAVSMCGGGRGRAAGTFFRLRKRNYGKAFGKHLPDPQNVPKGRWPTRLASGSSCCGVLTVVYAFFTAFQQLNRAAFRWAWGVAIGWVASLFVILGVFFSSWDVHFLLFQQFGWFGFTKRALFLFLWEFSKGLQAVIWMFILCVYRLPFLSQYRNAFISDNNYSLSIYRLFSNSDGIRPTSSEFLRVTISHK